ncbi:hypothetical protein ACJX0J_016551, partial [Zea mays]
FCCQIIETRHNNIQQHVMFLIILMMINTAISIMIERNAANWGLVMNAACNPYVIALLSHYFL